MNTERLSPRYADIDLWQPGDILDAMIEGQLASVAAVRAAAPAIEGAALAIEARLRKHGRLIYVGAGTSGRLSVQDGAELMPTFSWPADRLLLLLAGGEVAMTQAVEGAEDDVARAAQLIDEHGVDATDVLIATAASGTTPFTLTCMREARRRGCLTIGIANNAGTPLLLDADHPILLATGPEPIAGSTRMNAGTAQRITLNLLSTLVMIRLGRIYRGMRSRCRPAMPSWPSDASGWSPSLPVKAIPRCVTPSSGRAAASSSPFCCCRATTYPTPRRRSKKSAANCVAPSITSPSRPPDPSIQPPSASASPAAVASPSRRRGRNSYAVLLSGRFKSRRPYS